VYRFFGHVAGIDVIEAVEFAVSVEALAFVAAVELATARDPALASLPEILRVHYD